MRANERLYLTDDGELVTENDRRGRKLFCKPGDEIPDELARKHGLLDEVVEPEPEIKEPEKSKPKESDSGIIMEPETRRQSTPKGRKK